MAAQGSSLAALQPVMIDPRTRTNRVVPQDFSELDGLSRHGKLILGVVNGNVVAATLPGSVRVLATGAVTPSWTR